MKPASFFKESQPRMRHLAHLAFWLFVILGVLLRFEVLDVPDHDFEWFLSYLAFMSAFALLVPTLLFRTFKRLEKRASEELLGFIEVASVLAMAASWAGGFGLYRQGIGYDTFVHFSASALMMLVAFTLLVATTSLLERNLYALFFYAAVLTFSGGILNELFEYGGDAIFGTMMAGELGQPDDTLRDIFANSMGILVAAGIAYQYRDWLRKKIIGRKTLKERLLRK